MAIAIPRRWLTGIVFATVVTACGSAQPTAVRPSPDPEPNSPPAQPDLPPLPEGHIWRVDVMKVMSEKMGRFLQRIDVRESLVNGKFHGFRIVALKGPPEFWRGTDLRPGDVVTRVNGLPIGRDDEAYRAWLTLVTAPELVVEYERAGEPKVLRYVIHDQEEGAAADAGTDRSAAGDAGVRTVGTTDAMSPGPHHDAGKTSR